MVTGGFTKEDRNKASQGTENVIEVLVYLINLSWIADIL